MRFSYYALRPPVISILAQRPKQLPAQRQLQWQWQWQLQLQLQLLLTLQ
jgi:hypothetical protein